MKLLNKTAYNELMLTQEDTVCFQIGEEVKTRDNNYRDLRQSWIKISGKFEPTVVVSKTRICKKFSECEIDDLTRNPK